MLIPHLLSGHARQHHITRVILSVLSMVMTRANRWCQYFFAALILGGR